jgi:Glycosyltransferase 61
MARSSLIRVRELAVSSAPSWNEGGPVEVLEFSPPIEVDRRSALVEATVQPGVSSNLVRAGLAPGPSDSFEAPAARLVRLEDGMVETRMCVAMSPRFGFVRESVRQGRVRLQRGGYVVHETGELTFPDRETMSVDFPAVHVALPYERSNYFHWMFEALGGLLIARKFLPRDGRVVVRLGLEPFEAETLAAVGIAPDSVFVLPPDRVVHFPELYVLPRPFRKSAPAPIVASALRGLAQVRPDSAGPRRLYVTRSMASRRRIVNHDEVLVTLERHGFSEVAAEGLSVSEQIALFAQAEAVIGVHGAGLANAVFSAPGTLLIELQPERRESIQLLYWNVAAISGLRYVRIICKSLTRRRHSDLEVDCSHLDAVLRRRLPMLGESPCR